MIELKDIRINYGDFVAVENLNLEIRRGEFFTLLGPSGCGKTTTLRAIAGFLFPSQGDIFINEKNVTRLEPEARKVGFVFQNYALFPHMTVEGNIGFGLNIKKGIHAEDKNNIKAKIERYAEMVGVREQLKKNVTALSGGQQQRVAIARSLILEPEILLLDEPLSNLDTKLRLSMRTELKALQESLGITTVYVTHDQTEAMVLSDRIAVFNNGIVEQVGAPEDIYQSPASEHVCCFIGDANWLPPHIVEIVNKSSTNSSGKAYIRKEKLRITGKESKDKPPGPIFEALITSCAYMGMNTEYTLDFEGATLQAIDHDAPVKKYYPGQKVRVSISPEDIMYLGDGE